MAPTARTGMFRPLVPDPHWWVVLGGTFTHAARLTGRMVVFACCGSPCWPFGLLPTGLLLCPECYPGRQRQIDQQQMQQRQTFVGPAPGPETIPGESQRADARCRPQTGMAADPLPPGEQRAAVGAAQGRWDGWFPSPRTGRPPAPTRRAHARERIPMRLDDHRWKRIFGRVLGDLLRTERKRRGWYRRDLLDHLGQDLSLQTLATYELGTRQISVVRLVEVTNALGVSPIDLLHRTYTRVFSDPDQADAWAVDLVAASKIRDPELAPLRNWARCLLRTAVPEGAPKIAQLTANALEPLAELCGMQTRDLARRLPQPGLAALLAELSE